MLNVKREFTNFWTRSQIIDFRIIEFECWKELKKQFGPTLSESKQNTRKTTKIMETKTHFYPLTYVKAVLGF